MGESAWATLCYYVAVQTGIHNITGLAIRGLIMLHPYFSQEKPDKMIQYGYPGRPET